MYYIGATLITFQVIVLVVFGQPMICDCGYIWLWSGDIFSSDNSQHLTDWYTFSHVLHGVILYALLVKLFPKLSLGWLVCVALVLEVSWELLENTPWVINHYREQALAQGYTGDSVINSVADSVAMLGGLYLARALKTWQTLAMVVVFELGTLYAIRDNLTLNVLNLTFPSEKIQQWQARK